MNLFDSSINWLDKNTTLAYSFIRIFLGGALFVRGILFFSDPAALTRIAGTQQMYWWYSYITIIHIVGGLMLAAGFFSRIGALIQFPVLIGAVFFVHLGMGLMNAGQSLEFSALVLILLIIFFLFGSGQLSIDKLMERKRLKI